MSAGGDTATSCVPTVVVPATANAPGENTEPKSSVKQLKGRLMNGGAIAFSLGYWFVKSAAADQPRRNYGTVEWAPQG
jgi:hypothetical protein